MEDVKNMVKWFDDLDQVVKIILLIPIWGWLISALYRIFKYVEGENKNTVTLVIGIICLLPFLAVGFVFSIIDLVMVITSNKISLLAD